MGSSVCISTKGSYYNVVCTELLNDTGYMSKAWYRSQISYANRWIIDIYYEIDFEYPCTF